MKSFDYASFGIIVLVASFFAMDASAQDQNIAYFESDYILSKIPEYAGIEQRLTLLSDAWRIELQELDDEIEALEEDFIAKEILYTEDLRKEKRQEIDAKKSARDAYLSQKFGPKGEYFTRQADLLEPIQRQIFAAVRAVAQKKGIDFVFDRSGDIYMVYARSEWNLNDDILLELGINLE